MDDTESTRLRLEVGEIHVWHVPLPVTGAARAQLLLDAEEQRRAQRLRCPHARRRYVASRVALRHILARYWPTAAGALRFHRSAAGKPWLEGSTDLQFNLTRSGGYALVAVARGSAVGVDLEQVRLRYAAVERVAQFLAPAERAGLAALPASRRARALYHCWVSKEAYAKGCGCGLVPPLHTFEVSVDPDRPPALLRPYAGLTDKAPWTLHGLACPAGYTAALATSSASPRIRLQSWSAWDSAACGWATSTALPVHTMEVPRAAQAAARPGLCRTPPLGIASPQGTPDGGDHHGP